MNGLAHDSVYGLAIDATVSLSILPVRPDQAIVLRERKDGLVQKLAQFTMRLVPFRGFSMSVPTSPMSVAPTARPRRRTAAFNGACWAASHRIIVQSAKAPSKRRLAAILNRAYGFVSHFDLLQRLAWLEPVAALERSAGSLFLARCSVRGKI